MFLINFNQWKCACVGINNWVTRYYTWKISIITPFNSDRNWQGACSIVNDLCTKEMRHTEVEPEKIWRFYSYNRHGQFSHLKLQTKRRKNHCVTCYFMWLQNLISHAREMTLSEGVKEQNFYTNSWTPPKYWKVTISQYIYIYMCVCVCVCVRACVCVRERERESFQNLFA